MIRVVTLALLICCVQPVVAQTVEVSADDVGERRSDVRVLLDGIRNDLVAVRFEQALAAIEALLGRQDLTDAERGEALVLRSAAHVAFGDLAAAEDDYREILRLRPGFEPDSSLTPQKAMERFKRARTALIGELTIVTTPPDATVSVDGREISAAAAARLPLLAGEHEVRATREGFDPLQQTVLIKASEQTRVELRLVPNARTVIVQTFPAGVDVKLDGAWIGRTAQASDPDSRGTARRPARLVVENLSLGEHVFELSKPCFRTEIVRELLNVDLLDWTPRTLTPLTLVPVRSGLSLRDAPPTAEVRIDGKSVGGASTGPFEVCPGEHRIEVVLGGRRLWAHEASFEEAEQEVLEVRPRPNALLLGREAWPPELVGLAGACNVRSGDPVPEGSRLDDPLTWERLGVPADTDLVLAPRQAAGPGEPRWWLYSPVLRRVSQLDAVPSGLGRPRWSRVSWGLSLVDSLRAGPALVARVVAGGSAARAGIRPGDRLISLGGSQIDGAARANRVLAVASSGTPLAAEWLSPEGEARRGSLEGRPTVRLVDDASDGTAAAIAAAWAVVDGVADEGAAPAATANLALLLSNRERSEAAIPLWRRVALPDRPGIGRGTIRYYLGRDLDRVGAEADAIAALRDAVSSEATAFDDEGPAVAPAARDRLTDLGVSPD